MSPATERPIHYECPDCGYALEGVPTAGCPECGVHTRLAGRQRHMTRLARALVPLLAAGTIAAAVLPPLVMLKLFAPAGLSPGMIGWSVEQATPWLLGGSLPLGLINLALLGWAWTRPRSLFWLGRGLQDVLAWYTVVQAAALIGAATVFGVGLLV